MKTLLVGVVITLAAICAFVLVQKWMGDDLDGLAGEPWTVTNIEINGQKMPAAAIDGISAQFTKDSVIWTVPDEEGANKLTGELKLYPEKSPKEIDLAHPFAKGRASEGIYEVKGDTLIVCLGDRRPREFSSKGNLVITFKRR